MTIRDLFSYSARWDSIGLDCSFCRSFAGPEQWPDLKRVSRCDRHKVSLAVELGADGFKSGEWFCRDFNNNGEADEKAVKEFETVRPALKEDTLYGGYGKDGELKEVSFAELPR